MSSPAVAALFRKLLVKVHPDVVASQSEKFRIHNETTLKILLSCLDDERSPQSSFTKPPRLHFFLRDGGKTASVDFDRYHPERCLKILLGEKVTTEPSPSNHPDSKTNKASEFNNDFESEEAKFLRRQAAREMKKQWEDILTTWWISRRGNPGNLELLFRQNRLLFVPDELDWSTPVNPTVHGFELESAVNLLKETFEFHVKDSTLEALVGIEDLHDIAVHVVGKNLYRIKRVNRHGLAVPLGCPPDLLGQEIDKLTDEVISQVVEREAAK